MAAPSLAGFRCAVTVPTMTTTHLAELATQPRIPAAAMKAMLTSPDALFRAAVVARPDLGPDLLAEATNDRSYLVRSVALARSRDAERLATAATSLAVADRSVAACNPCTPEDSVARLMRDPSANVRVEILRRPGLELEAAQQLLASLTIKELLGGGSDAFIAIRASRFLMVNPHLRMLWLEHSSPYFQRIAATLADLTEVEAHRIARHSSRSGKLQLALNPFVPHCAVPNGWVRQREARHVPSADEVPLLLKSSTGRRLIISVGSVTLDDVLAASPELTTDEAIELVGRRTPLVYPHTLATLCDRFGYPVMREAIQVLSLTRVGAASLQSVGLRFLASTPPSNVSKVPLRSEPVYADNPEDEQVWLTVIHLAPRWNETLNELISAATDVISR